jgi:heme exporter protein D
MSFAEFVHMGGYAFYVWSAYGLALLVLALNVTQPWRRRRQLLRDIAARLRDERENR